MDWLNIMKKPVVTTITAAMLAAMVTAVPASADIMDDIRERGKIYIAIDPTFEPFEYTDADNNLVGYDVEIIEAITKDWGVEPDFQVMAFTGIIPGLMAGSFDMSASALNVTAERAERIDFTIPIAMTTNAVLINDADSAVKGSNIEDLSGLSCAVKQTTKPEEMMQNFNDQLREAGKPEVQLLGFDTVQQTLAALLAKRVDCVVDDKVVLARAIQSVPDASLSIIGEIGGSTPIAWGIKKSNPTLTQAINEGIVKLKKSGKLGELQEKYFGFEIENLPETDYIPAAE